MGAPPLILKMLYMQCIKIVENPHLPHCFKKRLHSTKHFLSYFQVALYYHDYKIRSKIDTEGVGTMLALRLYLNIDQYKVFF